VQAGSAEDEARAGVRTSRTEVALADKAMLKSSRIRDFFDVQSGSVDLPITWQIRLKQPNEQPRIDGSFWHLTGWSPTGSYYNLLRDYV